MKNFNVPAFLAVFSISFIGIELINIISRNTPRVQAQWSWKSPTPTPTRRNTPSVTPTYTPYTHITSTPTPTATTGVGAPPPTITNTPITINGDCPLKQPVVEWQLSLGCDPPTTDCMTEQFKVKVVANTSLRMTIRPYPIPTPK